MFNFFRVAKKWDVSSETYELQTALFASSVFLGLRKIQQSTVTGFQSVILIAETLLLN